MPVIRLLNVWLLEDEQAAAERMKRLLEASGLPMQLSNVIATNREYLKAVQQHSAPDLIFSDVELADGLVFQSFEKVPPPSLLVFTTAYDQYALKAIQQHGVGYLLKPIRLNELHEVLKYALSVLDQADKARMMREWMGETRVGGHSPEAGWSDSGGLFTL